MTVGHPRSWSSHSNLQAKKNALMTTSTDDLTLFHPHLGCCSYDLPDPKKKDKKWTISSLFRRKKKDSHEDVTVLTSDEDKKKKKRKSDKKKPKLAHFDHVILPKDNYLETTNNKTPDIFLSQGNSIDSLNDAKKRRERTKLRAVARRTFEGESSDESLNIRSEENLRHSSLNRRSRAARTERYLKRHSRDGENPLNYLRLSKSDVENSSTLNWRLSDDNRTPSPRVLTPRFFVSNSTSNPNYKPPLSMNDYNNSLRKIDRLVVPNLEYNTRSVSYDGNMHRANSGELIRPRYRNLSLAETSRTKQPPAPPPRDPSRLVKCQYYERPSSYLEPKQRFTRIEPPTYNQDFIRIPKRVPSERARLDGLKPNLLDQSPRSRRPILEPPTQPKVTPRKAADFWRQIEQNRKFLTEKLEEPPVKRKSSNLEDALDELEAIFNSLGLGDEDLLERAEQREKEMVQAKQFAYEPFDYPNKKEEKMPDITYDDVLFKKIQHANNTLKIPEVQPPFGIPVGPITLAANSDYLHATPGRIVKSGKVPDLVTDDLAFRNLRKDLNKDLAALPPLSPEDFKNNNQTKRKAVRSLSANIGSLIDQQVIERANSRNNNFLPSKTLDEVADAMQLARNILKDKEQRLSATRKAFLSDDSSSNPRTHFLNSLVLDSAPLITSTEPQIEQTTPLPKEPTSKANLVQTAELPDYENLSSDKEPESECKSPFEEHKAELIASFQELKQNMQDIEGVLTRAEAKMAPEPEPQEGEIKKTPPPQKNPALLTELKSPQLVLKASEPKIVCNPWYHDAGAVTIACSYGVACILQMASVDLFTIFGIILAILSLLAVLLN